MSNTTTSSPIPIPTSSPFPPMIDDGYSAGTTFTILFLFSVAVYFIGGVTVRKCIRGAEGTEVIPHYEFWNELPSLIRDGILFTINGCQPELTYERI